MNDKEKIVRDGLAAVMDNLDDGVYTAHGEFDAESLDYDLMVLVAEPASRDKCLASNR